MNYRKNKMKIFITLLTLSTLLILLTINCFAQVTQEWIQRYNGSGNAGDVAHSIVVDSSGNVYVTGGSTRSGTKSDYTTIKYNSSGVQQWVQRYNGTGNADDLSHSIAIDASGNVYFTGWSWGNGTSYDYATIKYNSSGVQQWVQRYNGSVNGSDYASSLAIDILGNVYVAGWSFGSQTNDDCTTIKYNSSGVQQWVQRYHGPGNGDNWLNSIAIDVSGNVYVTGGSFGNGTSYDYATIKYNPSGVQQWVERYNGVGNDEDVASSIAVDTSGNIYVTGYSLGSGTSYDYSTIKYNSSGVQQWVRRYNGIGNAADRASSIAVDASGNVYVTGYSLGSGTSEDYATIKYNSSGVQQWVQTYNGPGNGIDEASSIAVDASGNVYVTGWSTGTGTIYDYTTIRYNSSGVQQWVQRYVGTGNDYDNAYSIAVDASGNVYVTGGSTGSGTNYDYTTIKYSQQIGIRPISKELPLEYLLYQNYPNPFNPTTKIKFSIPASPVPSKGGGQVVSLIIYDILGREIASLLPAYSSQAGIPPLWGGQEGLSPGTYEVEWNGTNYPSGVYLYKLTSGEYTETKKLILLK